MMSPSKPLRDGGFDGRTCNQAAVGGRLRGGFVIVLRFCLLANRVCWVR